MSTQRPAGRQPFVNDRGRWPLGGGKLLSLRLLGGASIEGEEGALTGSVAQRHRIALLALLARAPSHRLTREKLIGFLWPESPSDRARHNLRGAVHVIRRDLDAEVLESIGDDLSLNVEALNIDVIELEAAREDGDLARIVELYQGPFLDGFYLDGSAGFEQWVDGERARLARAYRDALESLAREAAEDGQLREAVRWWRRLATEAPYDASVAVSLMAALASVGERAEALRQAEAHAELMREDFAAAPSPEVESLAARLRSDPPPGPDPPPLPVATSRMARPKALDGPVLPAPDPTNRPTRQDGVRFSSRGRRWAGAMGLVVMAGLVAVSLSNSRSADSVDPGVDAVDMGRVLVHEFVNETGDADLDPLGRMAADWIGQGLAGTGLLRVVATTDALNRESASHGRDAPGIILAGAYYLHHDSVAFQARLTEAASGEVLRSMEPIVAPTSQPSLAVDELRRRTAGALASILDPRLASWAEVASRPPSFEAYRLFVSGLDLHVRFQFEAALEPFSRAAKADSSFTMPLIWSAIAYRNLRRVEEADAVIGLLAARRSDLAPLDRALLEWLQAESALDDVGSYEALKRAAELAPGSEWVYLFGRSALGVRRPLEASEALTSVDPERGWLAEWLPYWLELAEAQHRIGEHDAELRDLRLGRSRIDGRGQPIDGFVRPEIRALAALGRLDELNATLDRFIAVWDGWPTRPGELMIMATDELRIHEHESAAVAMTSRMLGFFEGLTPDQREQLPWAYRRYRSAALYTARRWEEARTAYEEYLAAPGPTLAADLHGRLGILAARFGERDEAERQAATISSLSVEHPNGLRGTREFWRGAIAAHLGELDRAVGLLREAFAAGMVYAAGGPADLHVYPNHDLEPLRGYRAFEELIAPDG